MKECRKCHNEIPAYSDYCLHCGAKVTPTEGRTSLEKALIVLTFILSVSLISMLWIFLWPTSNSSDNSTTKIPDEILITEPTVLLESIPIGTEIELFPEAEPASGRLFNAARPATSDMCNVTINAPEGTGNLFAFEILSVYRRNNTTNNKNSFSSQYLDIAKANSCTKIYVRAGETATIKFPMGVYNVYLAKGDKWYGSDHLFGANTKYYLLCSNHEITTDDLNGTDLTLGKFGVGTFGDQTIGLKNISAEEFPN